MARNWRVWAAFGAVAVCALFLGNLATGIGTSVTTYNIAINESGLPLATNWSATANSVTHYSTTKTITFTGISAGSFCYTVSNPVNGIAPTTRYVPYVYYGCITVPNQLSVVVPYTTQYMVTFAVVPTSSGTVGPGTGWYNAGSSFAIQASSTYGYTFSKWTISPSPAFVIANNLSQSTELTTHGGGTVTAHFLAAATPEVFTEVGLPSGTGWSVVFAGTSYIGSTATLSVGYHIPSSGYSWSVAPVSKPGGVQYAPSPASGSMGTPLQTTQEIVFVKQFSVTLSTNPASSGSVTPSAGSYYFTNGTDIPILAGSGGSWVFSTWTTNPATSFALGNKLNGGTNVTISGTGQIAAKFIAGTPCTTCALTFNEVGLPAGTGWGVTFGGVLYTSSTNSVALTGLTVAQSWSALSPIGGTQYGVQYFPVSYTSSGYWYLGSSATITVVYVKENYVTVMSNPIYGGGSETLGSGWYVAGAQYGISEIATASTKFTAWTAGPNLTLTTSGKPSTAFTVNGPATITANFVPTVHTVHFQEFGLPMGTTWGASLNGQTYWSNHAWINVTGVVDGYSSWSAATGIGGGPGIQWSTPTSSGAIYVPEQTFQAVVYAEAVQVSVVAGGTSGGSTNPSGTTWYYIGSVLPVMASNGTSVSFTGWSSVVLSGSITFGSASSASTIATLNGPGTITATFA